MSKTLMEIFSEMFDREDGIAHPESAYICPHCNQPLSLADLRRALNSEIAKKKRPGAKGLVRNPKGRPKTQ